MVVLLWDPSHRPGRLQLSVCGQFAGFGGSFFGLDDFWGPRVKRKLEVCSLVILVILFVNF